MTGVLLAPCHDEFRGPRSDFVRQVALEKTTVQAHYEQLSDFEKGRIIELKEAEWANRRVARHMGRSDAAIRRFCLSNTSLVSQIARALSNRACLGYDGKATASNWEC
ncbi:hypothetical protein TNCV_297281 [Trichonephila clavipes]|nr:hypothetical protein TNCV_297281 [Trichonephila clavipes]